MIGMGAVVLSLVGWLQIVVGDGFVAMLIYRLMAHEWLWQSMRKKPPWAFSMSANGWSFSGNGQNPLETMKKMADDLLNPKPLSIDEKIDKKLEQTIDKTTDKIIELMLSDAQLQKQLQKQVFEKLKSRMENGSKKK